MLDHWFFSPTGRASPALPGGMDDAPVVHRHRKRAAALCRAPREKVLSGVGFPPRIAGRIVTASSDGTSYQLDCHRQALDVVALTPYIATRAKQYGSRGSAHDGLLGK